METPVKYVAVKFKVDKVGNTRLRANTMKIDVKKDTDGTLLSSKRNFEGELRKFDRVSTACICLSKHKNP